ncbi:glycosyltransferase family 2 protein [Nocardioides marmoraquaticus]
MSTASLGRSVPRVAVGLLTFHRPDRLARLIPMLADHLDSAVADGDAAAGAIIVVDNDSEGSAEDAVESAGRPDLVRYVVEARRGISYGRNRALDEAVADGADVLVFIDDDETPQAGWLRELLATYGSRDVQAVAGAVVSQPDGDLDPFVEAGGFLDRAHRDGVRTGEPIPRAATNNLLLDIAFVQARQLRFDPRFGTTGGGDSLFTSQLTAAGGRMVWCAESVVVDHVPADRMTPAWILSRSYNMASALVFVELELRSSRLDRVAFRALTAARETARLTQGAALVARGRATGSLRDVARGRRALARAHGAASGLRGRRSVHYPDPRSTSGAT